MIYFVVVSAVHFWRINHFQKNSVLFEFVLLRQELMEKDFWIQYTGSSLIISGEQLSEEILDFVLLQQIIFAESFFGSS